MMSHPNFTQQLTDEESGTMLPGDRGNAPNLRMSALAYWQAQRVCLQCIQVFSLDVVTICMHAVTFKAAHMGEPTPGSTSTLS